MVGLEISKMFYKKRVIFSIVFLMLIYTIMAYSMSRNSSANNAESPWHKENLQHELEYLKGELNRDDAPEDMKNKLRERISDIEYELEAGYKKARERMLNRELAAIDETLAKQQVPGSERKYLEKRREVIEAQLEYGENSHQVQRLMLEEQLESVRVSLTQQNTPEQVLRLKSEEREIQLRMEKTQPDNKHNAFYLLTMFFGTAGSFFLPLIIILVASEAISGEYSLGTIKLLLIKPFSRIKLFLSKYTALMIYGMFVFITVSILGYIIGGLFVGFGGAGLTRIVGRTLTGSNFNYFQDYTNAFLISNFQYLLLTLGLFLILLTAIVAFSMLVSVFTKSATISLVATMALVIFGNGVSSIFRSFEGAKYLLMPHLNILSHLEGNFMYPGITLTFSIVIIVVYAAICLAGGMYSFKRKDII